MPGQVWVTGDTHGEFSDLFNEGMFADYANMTRDDYVIICGDFGGVWYERYKERLYDGKIHEELNKMFDYEENILNKLETLPYTLLFVDGNHENFNRLYDYPVKQWNGGMVHEIRPNVLHLMRGEIFNLHGKKFFAFGGASSHDVKDGIIMKDDEGNWIKTAREWSREYKSFRIKDVSWWEQELPTIEERDHGITNLLNNGNEVDFVITHCLPQSVAAVLGRGLYMPDYLTGYFDTLIENGMRFNHWYCGHYHVDEVLMSKFHIMYYNMERIV